MSRTYFQFSSELIRKTCGIPSLWISSKVPWKHKTQNWSNSLQSRHCSHVLYSRLQIIHCSKPISILLKQHLARLMHLYYPKHKNNHLLPPLHVRSLHCTLKKGKFLPLQTGVLLRAREWITATNQTLPYQCQVPLSKQNRPHQHFLISPLKRDFIKSIQ